MIMKTYHEKTGELIESPDLDAGYVYPSQRYIGTKRVTLERTVELYPPGGLQHAVPVYEDCQLYHTYTAAELAARVLAQQPTQLDRVEAQVTYTAMMTDTLLEV